MEFSPKVADCMDLGIRDYRDYHVANVHHYDIKCVYRLNIMLFLSVQECVYNCPYH